MHRRPLAAAAVLSAVATLACEAPAQPLAAPAAHVIVCLTPTAGGDVVRPRIHVTGLRRGARYAVRLSVVGSAPAGCVARRTLAVRATTIGTLDSTLTSRGHWCFGRRYSGSVAPLAGTGPRAAFQLAIPAAGTLTGQVLRTQSCPVPPADGDLCGPVPLAGRGVVVQDAAGQEAGRATTDIYGRFTLRLAPGHYTVVAERDPEIVRTPQPVAVTVREDAPAFVQLLYLIAGHMPGPGRLP